MRYVVRTVDFDKQRAENVELLKSQIPNLEVVVDTTRNAYNGLFSACRLINDTGAVMLEDDILLCNHFCERIEAMIAEKGSDNVFNFFIGTSKKWEPTRLVGGSSFLWTQCIYLPPALPEKIINYHDQFKEEQPKRWYGQAIDLLIAYALVKEKRKYWRVLPALVQHLDYKSSIGPRPGNRQSPYFIDDMEQNNGH